ncbi:MAG: SDR family oxidoreductase [Puia sp.]|nr:SDR family oxidoreductase [Puia sp.]
MGFFQNKTIWITGASSGIGEALAYKFSAGGANLVLSSRRTAELERVRSGCANPERVKVLPLDLVDTASLQDRTAAAIAAFGAIDIMVHNGGISQRSLAIDTGLEIHRQVMELDYFSYVALTNHLLPHFVQKRSGHFVVMSSVMGKLGTPMRSSYAAAKHALHGYFDCLRAETAAQNIQVTVLTPGYIRTNISLNAITGDGSKLGVVGENIGHGLAPEKAAEQILRVIEAGKFETYIGKFGMEKIGLWMSRFFPGFVMRRAPRLAPK